MNITPHIQNLPVATAVNPPTDSLRRENVQRPIITAPTAPSGSPAEKGAADKDKGSGQVSDQLNFSELQKSAEKNAAQINSNAEQDHKEGAEHDADHPHNAQEKESNGSEADGDSHEPNSLEEFQHEKEIQQLKQRDQEVRSHELAHASVGGAYTGAPSYEFQVGPDDKKYAVNGEVSVDLSPVEGNPQATIAKMQKVHAAALAPANPSVQDTKVAAKAAELITQAQRDLIALGLEFSESENQINVSSPYNDVSEVFNKEKSTNVQSKSFDEQISQTLKAQEEIAPSLSSAVKARAERVEGYYLNISQAYEKSPSHQFEITA
ncbi:putative metalloprotease CJM1_0395 family protein [Colwellia sp. UCD-KL20]|uniref:putative metalloprotease CJM1_0395 family protein n=1 Tax=Colwellia sp. UCD-KL20 TaxID=1917165 RepID=UPI0009706ABB|nr:putative metalloprotease CJM1_0395 family protein [Colwellia sp. UCD-KL20]